MDLIFIGTSSGRTSLDRFHSSLLFNNQSKRILIDSGDGISRALLNHKIVFNSITDIIISHFHSDHLAGLPSLLTQMIIQGRTNPLNIYTHSDLLTSLKSFLQISFIFIETLKFEVTLLGYDFLNEKRISELFSFFAKQNSHVLNKHNLVIENLEFISSSFMFMNRNQRIIYTSDISNSNDLYLFKDTEPDIFITEATHIPLEILEEAVTILSPKKIYLTHIDKENDLKQWYEKLSDIQKDIIIIAEDGMKIKC